MLYAVAIRFPGQSRLHFFKEWQQSKLGENLPPVICDDPQKAMRMEMAEARAVAKKITDVVEREEVDAKIEVVPAAPTTVTEAFDMMVGNNTTMRVTQESKGLPELVELAREYDTVTEDKLKDVTTESLEENCELLKQMGEDIVTLAVSITKAMKRLEREIKLRKQQIKRK